MKNIPKEWLLLIIIVLLTLGISIFQWNKNKTLDTSDGVRSTPPRWSEQNNGGGIKNSPPTVKGSDKRLEKEENNVTVIIEYLPDKSTSQLFFRIALDTHSVNLDSFDFAKDIILGKDGKSFSPTLLKQEGSDHHRSAEVTFLTTSTPFYIVVRNLSNIPRREFYFEKL